MRLNLLGLDVCTAQEILAGEGISPVIGMAQAAIKDKQ